MAALLVGEKFSCTPSTLRFFTSSCLAFEQNLEFCKQLIRNFRNLDTVRGASIPFTQGREPTGCLTSVICI